MRLNLKKTLNWTDRVRIPQAAVRMELQAADDVPEVAVSSFGLDALNVPHAEEEWRSALVVLEARTTNFFDRAEVGHVHEVRVKSPIQYRGVLKSFKGVDGFDDILFTVKVISNKDGRLLAEGKNLRAGEEPAEREELLPVKCVDLGQQPWRVSWEQGGPVLEVNSRLQDADGFLARDQLTKGVVAPAAFRMVLLRLAMDDQAREDEWSKPWQRFIARLGSETYPEVGEDFSMVDEWVDRVVGAFCNRHAFADRINDHLSRGGEQ